MRDINGNYKINGKYYNNWKVGWILNRIRKTPKDPAKEEQENKEKFWNYLQQGCSEEEQLIQFVEYMKEQIYWRD